MGPSPRSLSHTPPRRLLVTQACLGHFLFFCPPSAPGQRVT